MGQEICQGTGLLGLQDSFTLVLIHIASLFIFLFFADWAKMVHGTRRRTQSNLTTHEVTGLLPFIVYSFPLIVVNYLGPSPPSKVSYYIYLLLYLKTHNIRH